MKCAYRNCQEEMEEKKGKKYCCDSCRYQEHTYVKREKSKLQKKIEVNQKIIDGYRAFLKDINDRCD